VVVAYVEAAPGQALDPELLKRHCARHLSGYKRPIAIHVVEALPRNAVGKIAKPALRRTHAAPAPGTPA
jgi:acyl-CoA synthetase (AMP-forming)/AMP-acid ligase II